ncbi:hypothetical protein WR25_03664 [Diploscapter pachys]|uniref:Uncharacterized protein n=1 Tax=Diploscapter pachys TaxID=2018661 RepID=A0A2A2M450_9BILA|nr:hypothetical protein WR25_03664 [Diploscapter pachys]
MDRTEGGGPAPDRGRRRGTRDAGGRGAGDCAGAARCDRGTGQDCRAGDAGSRARPPGQRAFAAVADRGERHGGPAAVDPAAGHAAARARRGGGAAVRAAGAAGAAQASAGQGAAAAIIAAGGAARDGAGVVRGQSVVGTGGTGRGGVPRRAGGRGGGRAAPRRARWLPAVAARVA